jgi:DNA-binding NarL/FixJ family response regulator
MPSTPDLRALSRTCQRSRQHHDPAILTTYDLDEYVFDALAAGASGFLLKDVTPEDLVRAVRVVADGHALLAPAVTRRLIEEFAAARPDPAAATGLTRLTAREVDVLRQLACRLSNAEIGATSSSARAP